MPSHVEQEVEISDIPEEDAIRLAQEGNAAAFEQLYRRYSGHVYSLCLRMVRNDSEAEDLTQEAFLRVFRKIRTFRGEARFSTIARCDARTGRGRLQAPQGIWRT